MTYDSVAAGLHDFMVVAGTSSATLVGLLFVGLSLHLRTVISAAEIRALARVTLSNFASVLFASMFLILHEGPTSAGWQLIGTGAASVIVVAPVLRSAWQTPELAPEMSLSNRVRLFLRFVLSAASYVAFIGAGFLLIASQFHAFVFLIEVVVVLLMLIALRNTWDLLVTVGEVDVEEPPQT